MSGDYPFHFSPAIDLHLLDAGDKTSGKLDVGDRWDIKWVMMERDVHESYVRPTMLYGSEAWCLKESEMGMLRWTERSMVREMYGVQL